jgi:Cft2 family RNA processing exonuclease
MIDSVFTFHPVGQGAFYSGKITSKHNRDHSFKMVCDCGSLSKSLHLKKSIADFKWNPKHPSSRFNLDVLFLSHLDDDHVNGVKIY